jgi:eukaryotic-like serine/threonine-protein kinase
MPDSTPSPAAAEPCPACRALMDVTGLEPWASVICSSCEVNVRVRPGFHHFTITREVGLGGMSRVFGARDESLGRDLALKILNRGLSQDDKRVRQFEKEAQITASISHPNVVKVYTAGRDQGYFYIAMELVEGGSLDEKIRKKGRLPEAWVLELAEQVVQGLKAASEAGLIHRDIKPGNILLSAQGTPKIVDFGLAVFTRDGVDDAEIWATPFYVPPETLHGEPEDFRSDVYALGSTLYHALMGKPLFSSDSSSLSELKALKSKPADLKEAAALLSQETTAILTRTLHRKPAQRYNSYDEFLDHLRYARRRLRRGGRGAPWPGRQGLSPAHWAGIAAALALGGGLWWKMSGSRPESGGPGGGTSGLLTDSDPSLGNDSSVSSKFLTARSALEKGDFANAREQFSTLAADPAVRQPTLGWAHYNAGLAALLAADLPGARSRFGALSKAIAASSAAPDLQTAAFFQKTAAVMDSDAPVPATFAESCPGDSAQAIGLLAAGLKNWQLGDLPGAAVFLRAFEAAAPPRHAAWVDRCKTPAKPWLEAIRLSEALPAAPLTNITVEAATSQLDTARAAAGHPALATAYQNSINARLDEFALSVQQLKVSVDAAQTGAMEQQTAAELERITSAETEAAPYGQRLEFSQGAARLRRCTAETSRGKEAIADRLRYWEGAAAFMETLTKDLTSPLEGTLDRLQGTTLRGLIASAPAGLKIKPASGAETAVPYTACPPATLAVLAERVLDRTADSDAYYQRREWLVAFARCSGLKAYAAVAGHELAREHPGFRALWSRLGPP